jgi:hypothetical protein
MVDDALAVIPLPPVIEVTVPEALDDANGKSATSL